MPRVSEDHLIARREQILVAARVCFLRNGLHNTTMQDLIAEAGLSVGAVYRYFKSKTEIINAIAESVAGGITVLLQEVAVREPAPTLAEAMSEILDAIDAQVAEDGNFPLALQVWGEATLDPAIREIVRHRYDGIRDAYVTLSRRAVERGELASDTDVEATASVLFGMIPGYALQRLFLGRPDKETYLRGVRALLNRR